jgi:hypothetical protein
MQEHRQQCHGAHNASEEAGRPVAVEVDLREQFNKEEVNVRNLWFTKFMLGSLNGLSFTLPKSATKAIKMPTTTWPALPGMMSARMLFRVSACGGRRASALQMIACTRQKSQARTQPRRCRAPRGRTRAVAAGSSGSWTQALRRHPRRA